VIAAARGERLSPSRFADDSVEVGGRLCFTQKRLTFPAMISSWMGSPHPISPSKRFSAAGTALEAMRSGWRTNGRMSPASTTDETLYIWHLSV
jgi:hypothetical protein